MAIFIDITEGIVVDTTVGAPSIETYTRDTFLDILEEDIDMVFIGQNGREFAENQNTVEYTHATGEVENYPVIFDNPYASQKVNSETNYTGINPQFMIQETKLVRNPKTDDRVTVRGVLYYVKDYHSDGVGITTIYLRRK